MSAFCNVRAALLASALSGSSRFVRVRIVCVARVRRWWNTTLRSGVCCRASFERREKTNSGFLTRSLGAGIYLILRRRVEACAVGRDPATLRCRQFLDLIIRSQEAVVALRTLNGIPKSEGVIGDESGCPRYSSVIARSGRTL